MLRTKHRYLHFDSKVVNELFCDDETTTFFIIGFNMATSN